jgi:chorismate mutase
VAVRAIRGAIQLEIDEREHLLARTRQLVREVLRANAIDTESLISILFTVTADLRSEFPALAARELGLGDVPLLCTTEIDVPGALPRVVRLMAHAEMDVPRADVQHVYLCGAEALRRDLAQ